MRARNYFLLIAWALYGCEINPPGTAAKLKRLERKYAAARYRGKPIHHSQHQPQRVESVTVTADWLRQYKALEEVHGNYRIPDDAKSEVMPDGKVRVTRNQIKHYNDLVRAPIPEVPPPLTDEPRNLPP